MRQLRGLTSLVHDAVDATTDLVGLGHAATARRTMAVLTRIPPLAGPARAVDAVRHHATAAVLGSVKLVNRVVRTVTDAGMVAVSPATVAPDPLVPMRSDAVGSPVWIADAAMGLANGIVGDHLDARRNGLDLGMALRSAEGWIGPGASGIPADAGPRIVVLVHGLATTEWSWCLDAGRLLGDPAANVGTLLHRDLGYTPVWVRYNSGRHISENGRALADQLRDLLAAWPHPVEEVVLVGHSMGGLVSRSALHHGHARGDEWVARVRRAVTIASPLDGARLERFASVTTRVLDTLDLPATAIPARILTARSAGIKDLRYGNLRDEDWEGHDPDALPHDHRTPAPVPEHVAWCFVAATLTETADHPFARAFGDLLVHPDSAHAPAAATPRHELHHVGGVDHARALTSPAVYERVRAFCAAPPEARLEG